MKNRIKLLAVSVILILLAIMTLACGGSGDNGSGNNNNQRTVTVSFDLNYGSGTVATGAFVVGQPYGELFDAVRLHYVFSGWFLNAEGTGAEITPETIVSVDNNHTLFAQWIRILGVTIHFCLNYPDAEAGPASIPVALGAYYGTLPSPEREHFIFNGWYTTARGTGNRVIDSTRLSHGFDHTLYARWTGKTVQITFNLEGGTLTTLPAGISNDNGVISREAEFGSIYGIYPIPSRAGSVFVGWFKAPTGGEQVRSLTAISTASAHTLYARYRSSAFDFTNADDTPFFTVDAWGGAIVHDTANNWLRFNIGRVQPYRDPATFRNQNCVVVNFPVFPNTTYRFSISFINNANVTSVVIYDNLNITTGLGPGLGSRTYNAAAINSWNVSQANPRTIEFTTSGRAQFLRVRVHYSGGNLSGQTQTQAQNARAFFLHNFEVID